MSQTSAPVSLSTIGLQASPYIAYAYSYPHKTAYRPLIPARPLEVAWASEPKNALFLYVHIPFCEMRCGFCNLFTTANPRQQMISDYLGAVARQAAATARALSPAARVARMAIGGGTPTFLEAPDLERLLTIVAGSFGIAPGSIPVSVETSPRTAQRERLAVLHHFGVERVSIGVQSFVDAEVSAAGRAQEGRWVDEALQAIRDAGFSKLNLDLIYGLPGQTVQSWLVSVRRALSWRPEELYLYPLYVRPLTGLGRRGVCAHDTLRLVCYRAGRELLLSEGYEQVSMRMFRLPSVGAGESNEPIYCCQDDGMVGIGSGARSYTRTLHYSTEFAVGAAGVREIISDYVGRSEGDFASIDYGVALSDLDQRRRWLIKSLFRSVGLDARAYAERFGSEALADFPELATMRDDRYFTVDRDWIVPTAKGLEWSDALAPSLFAQDVQRRMETFELR